MSQNAKKIVELTPSQPNPERHLRVISNLPIKSSNNSLKWASAVGAFAVLGMMLTILGKTPSAPPVTLNAVTSAAVMGTSAGIAAGMVDVGLKSVLGAKGDGGGEPQTFVPTNGN